MKWAQKPGNPFDDLREMFRSLQPQSFSTGDRAWLVVQTSGGNWAVLVGPDTLSTPVLVVQAGRGFFWCYLGAGHFEIKNGSVVDAGPKIEKIAEEDLFRYRIEAEVEANRRNAEVRSGA